MLNVAWYSTCLRVLWTQLLAASFTICFNYYKSAFLLLVTEMFSIRLREAKETKKCNLLNCISSKDIPWKTLLSVSWVGVSVIRSASCLYAPATNKVLEAHWWSPSEILLKDSRSLRACTENYKYQLTKYIEKTVLLRPCTDVLCLETLHHKSFCILLTVYFYSFHTYATSFTHFTLQFLCI